MDFTLPIASKQRLDELLTYLGDRAIDFKKCFDIESEWCLKYADLIMRGTTNRTLEYGERHHIVPVSYYRENGYDGSRENSIIDKNNWSTLTFAEHLYAHYCVAQCTSGRMMHKMIRAFWTMYSLKTKNKRHVDISELELLESIGDSEATRIISMHESVAKVTEEGRTHHWEDKAKAKHDYAVATRDHIREYKRAYIAAHIEDVRKYKREWAREHSEDQREYRQNNSIKIKERQKTYREENKPMIIAGKKKCYANNREHYLKKANDYRKEMHTKGYWIRLNPITRKPEWTFLGKNYKPKASTKTVIQYDLDGVYMATYASLKEAGDSTHINFKNISAACLGHIKSSGGFKWKYATDVFVAIYDPNYVELDGSPFYTEEDFLEPTGT